MGAHIDSVFRLTNQDKQGGGGNRRKERERVTKRAGRE